jgi:Permeases of the drug/metabolite transporter (DMT) superfamily
LNKEKLIANSLLLLTAVIWGSAFVAQRVGMNYVGPFTFQATRFTLACVVLIPVIYFMGKSSKKQMETSGCGKEELSPEEKKKETKALLKAGITCGTILFCGSSLQQFGLVFTSAGKAGFITALYIILVPVFSLALRQRPGFKCWIGVAFGAVGLYFLCITESFSIAPGDLIVLIGAVFWACHVLVIDHFLPKVSDPIKMSFIQFVTTTVYSYICALIFEDISWNAIMAAAVPILYAGALSGGIGFTLQILGQKHTNPTVASLLLSMESVFAAVFGFLLLNEMMSFRETLGCVLMFIAIIVSQLPDKKKPVMIS